MMPAAVVGVAVGAGVGVDVDPGGVGVEIGAVVAGIVVGVDVATGVDVTDDPGVGVDVGTGVDVAAGPDGTIGAVVANDGGRERSTAPLEHPANDAARVNALTSAIGERENFIAGLILRLEGRRDADPR